MKNFVWPVIVAESRLRGHYERVATKIEEWGDISLISIKTEKGKITITNKELIKILEWLGDLK
jgi:hypothetical protein